MLARERNAEKRENFPARVPLGTDGIDHVRDFGSVQS
jgi:hypothetical protein